MDQFVEKFREPYAELFLADHISAVIRVQGERPEPLTEEEKREFLATRQNVSLGSDAFFPFGDNIERARRSGVTAIVQPGGSIRDQQVIDTCNKYGIAMAFCGIRLFHH